MNKSKHKLWQSISGKLVFFINLVTTQLKEHLTPITKKPKHRFAVVVKCIAQHSLSYKQR